jgi:methylmalonyl-CoA mutase N-terminal domain/subunit
VDPLAGSYYVEWLTGEMEKKILEEMEHVERLGGIVEAVKSGAIQAEVARQAYLYEQRLLSGEIAKVAVNRHVAPDAERPQPALELYAFDPEVYEAQVARLRRLRAERDGTAVTRALGRLGDEGRGTGNLMEPILDAVRAYATLGEMAAALKNVFGEHKEAAGL